MVGKMSSMKKLIVMMVLVVFVFTMYGCGGSESGKDKESGAEESTATLTELPETPTSTPTNTPTPTPKATETPTPTPLPTATPTPVPEVLENKSDVTSVRLGWSGEAETEYVLRYREKDGEWMEKTVTGTEGYAGGLKKDTDYELEVLLAGANEGENNIWLEKITAHTEKAGAGDPFKDVYGKIVVGKAKKDVAFTSEAGCLGAKIWPQHKCSFFSDPELTKKSGALAGGEELAVTETEDGYCYLRKDGRYSLYMKGKNSKNEEIEGWVDADLVMINVADIFSPGDKKYGIHIDRTNAYNSIFTAGGSATQVDYTSAEESRYDVIRDESKVFSEMGYNVIFGITGTDLPNYGPKDQMPVVWDLAMSLIVCQKNALEKGTALLIYDGYRPNSTSHAVCDAIINYNYLSVAVNGTNLARGFSSAKYGPRDYIGYNSRHNMGIAVDLTIIAFDDIDKEGAELVMQSKMHTLDFRCNMSYNNDNANLLYEIMTTGSGLQPLSNKAEWWHFELIMDAKLYPQIKTYIYADYEI